jgi:hypothetical protein
MTTDFAKTSSIAAIASGAIGSELTFAFPKVLEAIGLYTENDIAVLGVEVLEVRPTGYFTKNLSVYDLQMARGPIPREGWPDYVKANNVLAEKFVKLNPTGDDHVYVLTTASWRECQKME